MSNVDIAKRIHKDVDSLLKGLTPDDQEAIVNEAHNIVQSLRKIGQITSKVKAQAPS